jgi:predicted nucleic acid-binding protein
MNKIEAALTTTLTAEEKSPKPKETEKPTRIVFKGNLEEVNRFCYKRGWTDGLPIIPPTEEAVAEMLTGTDLPKDEVIAELAPRRGKATVEKIAINAVKAGLPTYMPIMIAGTRALLTNIGRT